SAEINFERIAVTPDQIRDWNLPTRPTKQTDTRAKKFGSVNPSSLMPSIPAGCVASSAEPSNGIFHDTNTGASWRQRPQSKRSSVGSWEWLWPRLRRHDGSRSKHGRSRDVRVAHRWPRCAAGAQLSIPHNEPIKAPTCRSVAPTGHDSWAAILPR